MLGNVASGRKTTMDRTVPIWDVRTCESQRETCFPVCGDTPQTVGTVPRPASGGTWNPFCIKVAVVPNPLKLHDFHGTSPASEKVVKLVAALPAFTMSCHKLERKGHPKNTTVHTMGVGNFMLICVRHASYNCLLFQDGRCLMVPRGWLSQTKMEDPSCHAKCWNRFTCIFKPLLQQLWRAILFKTQIGWVEFHQMDSRGSPIEAHTNSSCFVLLKVFISLEFLDRTAGTIPY